MRFDTYICRECFAEDMERKVPCVINVHEETTKAGEVPCMCPVDNDYKAKWKHIGHTQMNFVDEEEWKERDVWYEEKDTGKEKV